MKVITYKKVGDFLNDNYSDLINNEITAQLLFYSAMVNKELTTYKECIFGKVIDENKNSTVLIFLNCLPNNLLVNPISMDGLYEAINDLSLYFIKHKVKLNGLNAKKEICDLFIKCMNNNLSNKKKETLLFEEHLALDIMALRKLKAMDLKEGRTRLANTDELGLINNYMVDFYREALHEEVSYEEQVVKVERLLHNNKIYVFENQDHQIVTMAATTRTLVNGVCINYVYTPREYRGHGFAKTNMYHICKGILEEGYQFCSLFVDKTNPISNQVYIDVGFMVIDDQYAYVIK